jgi:hypothetical protein
MAFTHKHRAIPPTHDCIRPAVWGLLACILFALSPALAEAKGGRNLGLVGSSGHSRSIELTEQRNGLRTGTLTLVIRNTSARSGKFRLSYHPDDSESRVRVAIRGTPKRLRPSGVRAVRVRFVLPSSREPEAFHGMLVATLVPRKKAKKPPDDPPPLAVNVKGVPRPIRDVIFEPDDVVLRPVRVWPFKWQTGGTAKIRFRGPGTKRVFDELRHRRSTVLRNADGHTVRVALQDLRLVTPDQANARVVVKKLVSTGKYTGRLVLSDYSDGPALGVTVEGRHPILWAILVVFAGAVLGGYALPRWRVRRRKEWLLTDLREAIDAYDTLRGSTKHQPASWSLDRRLGAKPRSGRRWDVKELPGLPDYYGVAGLDWRVRNAFTPNDVEQDRVAVNVIIDAIGRWRIVEEPAKKLNQELRKPPADRPMHSWRKTRVWRTTQRLLVSVHREPGGNGDVYAVADKLDRQHELYSASRDLWNAQYAVDKQIKLPTSVAAAVAGLDIDALDGQFPELGIPTDQEYDELVVEITTAHGKVFDQGFTPHALDRLLGKEPKEELGPAPPAERVEPREVGPAYSAALGLSAAAAAATVLFPSFHVIRGVMELASRRRGAGDGEKREPPAARQAGRAARRRRGPYKRLLGWTYRRDVLWTFGGALVGVVAYVLTIYGATWGTLTDYLAAFATGFGSSTIVRWAELPGGESLRRTEPIPGARKPDAKPDVRLSSFGQTTTSTR